MKNRREPTKFNLPSWMAMLVLWISTSMPLGAEPIHLPNIGDSAADFLSPARERRIGEAVMRNIRRAGAIIDDLLVSDYLNDLGYRLISAGEHSEYNFTFFIIDDPEINAFALPGGFIGVHYGLFLAAEKESQLAAVLSHEIAHVTQRHHARSYKANQNNIPVTAALLAAIILGGQGDLTQAALASAAAKSAQDQLDFTRANEHEADRIGISLLANAGFNPASMGEFFGYLARANRLHGSEAPDFLRTHPVTEVRIAEAMDRARQLPVRKHEKTQSNFQIIRERLRILTSKNTAALVAEYRDQLASGRYKNENATRYGYALGLIKTGQPDLARTEIKKLIEKDPNRIAYQLAMAEIYSATRQTAKALEIYRAGLKLMPGNALFTYQYSDALTKLGRYKDARKVLKDYLRQPQPFPEFYRLLAGVEAKLGETSNASETLAEFYYQTGQTHKALSQLKEISKQKGLDFYQASRVEARISELKRELALQAEAEVTP